MAGILIAGLLALAGWIAYMRRGRASARPRERAAGPATSLGPHIDPVRVRKAMTE